MRFRLILSFIGVVLVSVISVVIFVRQGAVNEVRSLMFRGGMVSVADLTETLQEYYQLHQSWEGVESQLSVRSGGHGKGAGGGQGMMGMMGQRLRLADVGGNILADSSNGTTGGKLSQAELSRATQLQVNQKTVGYLLAEGGMGYSSNDERLVLNRLNVAALTAGLMAGVISLLLALALAYGLLRPVQELTRAAQRLGQGDLSQRVKISGSDELAVLGRSFNRMADSLQAAKQSRQALTADIAHELRNPLAVQRANLEALQDGIYPLSAENLQPVLEQNLLLSHLVDDLRILALADAGQLALECTPVDFPPLVERIVERFWPQAAIHQVELVFEPLAGGALAQIDLDPMRTEQILNNVISNALRYTPEGGQIRLSFTRQSAWIQLHIHDSGPGIPEDALPHIFERFYRADRARSRADGGSGLGLAIARQLAEAQGGALTAANHPMGGAIFTLALPIK